MLNTLKYCICVFGLVIMSGCSNPYSKFYQDFTNGENIFKYEWIIPPQGEPRILTGSNPEHDNKKMMEEGYVCIGISNFNSGEISQQGAIQKAKKVNADTVVLYCNYTSTVSGVMPLTVPNTQTSYHSGNIYGMGGSTSYSGTSTTYGSTTTYMPYNVRRYDYLASYWIKRKYCLGIMYDNLTDEQKKEIGSNKGAYVTIVVKGTPAFASDILTNDIIRKVNGVKVIDMKHLADMISNVNEAEFEIIRSGGTITKKIRFDP